MKPLADFFLLAFGEIDISKGTLAFIIFISIFVFISVALSTVKLIQALLQSDDL